MPVDKQSNDGIHQGGSAAALKTNVLFRWLSADCSSCLRNLDEAVLYQHIFTVRARCTLPTASAPLQALQKEQAKSAKFKAFAATQVIQ